MKEVTKYDSQNRPIEIIYTDDEGNLMENQYGVTSIRSSYLSDDNLYSREERCYDLTGNPIEDSLGVHMIRRIWDPTRRMETETYHNLQGELVEILYGFCEVHYHMDDSEQLHSVYCYDRKGRLLKSDAQKMVHSSRRNHYHVDS